MQFFYRGKLIYFDLPSATGNVGRIIGKGRFYEQLFLEYIVSFKLKGTYLDIGCNVGNHSIFFGKFSCSDKIIGLDANNYIFNYFVQNINLNSLQNKIYGFNFAVGDKDGLCGIKINPYDKIGGASVIEGSSLQEKRLDTLFPEENISLIKIDVEGFELNVLQGATLILSTKRPELFIECSTATQYKVISNFLSEFGYKMITCYNNTATYHFSTKFKSHFFSKYFLSLYFFRRILRSS